MTEFVANHETHLGRRLPVSLNNISIEHYKIATGMTSGEGVECAVGLHNTNIHPDVQAEVGQPLAQLVIGMDFDQ